MAEQWHATKSRQALRALLKLGWQSKEARVRTKYSLVPDVVFGFHDDDEIGPRMLARIAERPD